jgi:hypothetical protein
MKSFRFEMGILLLPMMLLTSCLEDDSRDLEKVSLTFSFALKENKEGRATSAQLSAGASVLISVQMSTGELMLDQQEVAIHKDADGYVTAPLQLPAGNYRLVDFMVVGESGEILYAAPRQGSLLSQKTARSLPYNFVINSKETFDNRIAVLDTRTNTSKDFGYDSFRAQSHSFKLQVYITEGKKLLPASAEALIMKGLDTLRVYQLSKNINTINFSGDPAETYSLVVVKDSYSRFAQNFTIENINAKPIKVVMEPALTVVGLPIADQNYFAMQLDPAWGIFDYMVDWGDGTNQTWTSGITTIVDHFYQQPGHYFISITGHALDSVVLVGNITGGGDIARLGMDHLVNLRDFRIEYGQGPKVIDLSNNKFLNEIRIYPHPFNESPLEDLIIPNDAFIYNMEIGANKNMKPESLNEVINDIHHQVVNNPRSGDFWYSVWEDGTVPMVTPSQEALVKLSDLKNTYHWNVNPDPDMLLE